MAAALLIGANTWATTWPASSIADINNALANENFANGDIIQLTADIDYGTHTSAALISIQNGVIVTLDLNGKTISGNHSGAVTSSFIVEVQYGATLTISNGSILNNSTSCSPYQRVVANFGTLTMNNVNITVEQGQCLLVTLGGNTTLTACNFATRHFQTNGGGSSENACIDYRSLEGKTNAEESTLTINSGSYNGGRGGAIYMYTGNAEGHNLVINGGTFTITDNLGSLLRIDDAASQCTIFGGIFQEDPSAWLDQSVGYHMTANNMYEVLLKGDLANYTASTFAELVTYLDRATTSDAVHVTLSSNVAVSNMVTLKHGSTLTIPAGTTLNIIEGGALVNRGIITNNGTINIDSKGYLSSTNTVEGSGNITGYEERITINDNAKTITATLNGPMDLQWLAYVSKLHEDYIFDVTMNNDITLPNVPFDMIPYFQGNFDGQNHSIRNLILEPTGNWSGLIWMILGSTTIKDLTINISCDKAKYCTAALVGLIDIETAGNYTILFDNVTTTGNITATTSFYGAGGFVGQYYAETNVNMWFANCVNNVNVTLPNGYNTGAFIGTTTSITGSTNFGFYNCKNNATISSKNANGCFIGYGCPKVSCTLEIIACSNIGNTWICNPGSLTPTTTNADPTTYVAVWDETQSKYIAREIGEIVQPTTPTIDWAQNTTWTDGTDDVVPTASDAVEMTNNVEINNGTDAEAQSLTIANDATLTVKDGGTLEIGDGGLDVTNGTLIIEPGAEVRVNGEVISTSEDAITISSNGTEGTSVFVVNPDIQQTNIQAKIQLYTTARHETSPVNQYIYNYVGIPTSTAITSSDITREAVSGDNTEDLTMYLYGWNVQTGWQQGGWELLSQPFRGVALTSESTAGTIFTFEGTLVGNGDGQMNFNHKGFNFFANSYTAPINIQTLLDGFSNDVRATIYIYDSQSNRVKGVSRSDFAGYFTPAFTVIPSMQAFFVFTEEKNSVTEEIDYRQMVWNNTASNTPLNAPARLRDNGSFDRIRINVSSLAGANDQVQLVSEERFSTEFDNGYDAVKFMNQGQANIYATTDEHSLQNLFTDNLEGVFIGFTANNDENTYVLSFDEVAGEQHAIKDLMNGRVTLMAAGNTYTFTQPEGTTFDHRFQIVDREEVVTSVENIDNTEIKAEGVYTITGQYVGTYDMWNNLPAGVYVVNGVKVVK